MPIRRIKLRFPRGGLDKSLGLQAQRPFTSPELVNVVPLDPQDDRDRGGSRFGLGEALVYHDTSHTPEGPIRMLANLRIVTAEWTHWSDLFDGSALDAQWNVAPWIVAPPTLQFIRNRMIGLENGELCGYNLTPPRVFDPTDTHYVELFPVPYEGEHAGTYYLYAGMDEMYALANLHNYNSVEAKLVLTGALGLAYIYLTEYVGGYIFESDTDNNAAALPNYPETNWMKLEMNRAGYSQHRALWPGLSAVITPVAVGGTILIGGSGAGLGYYPVNACCYSSTDDLYYGIESGTGNLFTFDRTGTATLVGTLTGAPADCQGLEEDPSGSQEYLWTVEHTARNFIRVKKSDGSAVVVGALGGLLNIHSLAYDSAGAKLYALEDGAAPKLYWINTATGAANLVAGIVGTLGSPVGMAYAPEEGASGTMYLVTDSANNNFYSLNTTTGVATKLADITGSGYTPNCADLTYDLVRMCLIAIHDSGTGSYIMPMKKKASGQAQAFGFEGTAASKKALLSNFRQQHKLLYEETVRNRLHIISSRSSGGALLGEMYEEQQLGAWGFFASPTTLGKYATDRFISHATIGQTILMADHDGKVKCDVSGCRVYDNGADNGYLIVKVGGGATYWSDLDVSTDADVCVVTEGAGVVIDGAHTMDSLPLYGADQAILLKRSTTHGVGAGAVGDTCTVHIERGAKSFNRNTSPAGASNWQSTIWQADVPRGQVPHGCACIARFMNRMWLAAPWYAPHTWYASRSGNPNDWDYGADPFDSAKAIAGSSADASDIAEPIRDLVPCGDDYMLFMCSDSIWRLAGDPGLGTRMRALSRSVGLSMRAAWCFGPDNSLYWLYDDGIYWLPPGAVATPKNITVGILPADLKRVSADNYQVFLAYDRDRNGIWVFMSGHERRGRDHYFLDLTSRRIWPIRIPSDFEPTAILEYKPYASEERCVILGCRDGKLRRFRWQWESDEGADLGASMLIGPIRAANNDWVEGIITKLAATLDVNSNDVEWELVTGATAEEVVTATARDTGTWVGGRNRWNTPHRRAAWFGLRINGKNSLAFAIEDILVEIEQVGPQV